MTYGPVAQWESVRFTRGRSLVRSQPGPQKNTEGVPRSSGDAFSRLRAQLFESTAVRGHGRFGMQTVVAGRRATISVAWSKRHFATEKVTALSTEKVDSSVDDSDLSVFQDAESRWERWRAGIAARPTLNLAYRIGVGVVGTIVFAAGIVAIPYPRAGCSSFSPASASWRRSSRGHIDSFIREGSIRPVHGMVRQAVAVRQRVGRSVHHSDRPGDFVGARHFRPDRDMGGPGLLVARVAAVS